MRRLTIHLEIAFGKDEPEPEYREAQTIPAHIERANPDPCEQDAARQPIGFGRAKENRE